MGHSTEVLKKTKNRIIISSVQLLSSVQSLSCVRLFTTPWIAARQAALSINTVVSNSLQPHGLQHTRPACPSPTSRACSNSCPLSHWCHSTISSSVVPFTSCLQSSPASESFPMSQFFSSGGQSIGASVWGRKEINIQIPIRAWQAGRQAGRKEGSR